MTASHNLTAESKEEVRSLCRILKNFEKNYQGTHTYCKKNIEDKELISGIQLLQETYGFLSGLPDARLCPQELKLDGKAIDLLEKAKKKLNEAIPLLEKFAQKGNAEANDRLGDIFTSYSVINYHFKFFYIQTPDEEKAIAYYSIAAQAGYSNPLKTLQCIYTIQKKFSLAACITRSLIQANPECWEDWINDFRGVFIRYKLKDHPRVCYYLTTALFYVEKRAASLDKENLTELVEQLASYKEDFLMGYDKFQFSQFEAFNEEVIFNKDEALIEFITQTRKNNSRSNEMNDFGNKLPSGPIRFFYHYKDFSITPELTVKPIIFSPTY